MRPLIAAALLLCACSDRFYTLGFTGPTDTLLGRDLMNRERQVAAHALGDLDGDRRLDVAAVSIYGEVNVLISRLDGSFGVGVAYQTPFQGPALITAGDLNGDGLDDVAVSHVDQNRITLFDTQRDGLLAARSNPIDIGCRAAAIAIEDADNDGRRDVVVACKDGPRELRILRNLGGGQVSGSFSLPYVLPGQAGNAPDPRSIAIGELNGDGIPDIAIGTAMDLRILVNPREALGSLEATLISIPYTAPVRSVAIADLDGNGRSEVAALINDPNGATSIVVYEHTGGGSYRQNLTLSGVQQSGRNNANLGLSLADVNGDGLADVVVTQSNQAELRVVPSRRLTGTQAELLSLSTSLAAGPNGSSVGEAIQQVGDVSGDGRPDVVLRYPGTNRIGVLLNGSY